MDGLRPSSSLIAYSGSYGEMDLYVKFMKTISLKLKGSETIKNLKEMINEKEGINEEDLDLFIDGNLLDDDGRTLDDCGIESNDIVHLVVKDYILMTIYVKMPYGLGVIAVVARRCDTIRLIKSKVQMKAGILPDNFALAYGDHLLADDWDLVSLDIKDNSTLNLLFGQKPVLSIFVKIPGKDTIVLSVKVTFTINDIKAIIGSIIGDLYSNNFYLFHAGRQLEDSKILVFLDIKEGSLLELFPAHMPIFVKTWSGNTLTLNVRETDTVKDIKANIFDKLQIPIQLQSIVYAGKRLEDDRDLASYKIQKNSTLHMVFAPSSTIAEIRLTNFVPFIEATTGIQFLKNLIRQEVPVEVKEFLFKGKPLKDELTLAHYNMGADAKVQVVF